ncbi:MAG: VOC family protein [Pseudomonadota bacterium]|nr:VOC family protein [Pseudomonadota bacterium]
MIGYVTLGTDDLDRARGFYDALMGSIGASRLMQIDGEEAGGFTMYGRSMAAPAIVLIRPNDRQPADCGNGNMIALAMNSRERVDAFYAKAIELGGTDAGRPGYRGDPALGQYFAYVRDLDRHKLAAFNIAPGG